MNNLSDNVDCVNTESRNFLINFFVDNLSKWPYCTERLGTLYKLPKNEATIRKYIQHNRNKKISWLVFDIDRTWNPEEVFFLNYPIPNIAVINPENEHAHLFYGLKFPISLYQSKNPDKVKFYNAVYNRMKILLNADMSYYNFISRNPLFPQAAVSFCYPDLYDLFSLWKYVEHIPFKKRSLEDDEFTLGRNDRLFKVTKKFAYSEIRRHFSDPRSNNFLNVIYTFAFQYNIQNILNPLPIIEIKSIAKSVHSWVRKHFSEKDFTQWGDARRAKSIISRQKTSDKRAIQICDILHERKDLTKLEIAELFHVSLNTVKRACRKFSH